jgi:Fe-S oxidoreductase
MHTDVAFDGAERLASGALGFDPAAPAGSLGALALGALPASAARAVGAAGYWLHLVLILVFLNFLPFGKHFHIITALPNVFLRSLPPGSAALRKLDLESEDASFGTRTVADLSWKEGLDVYSCTECGRCQTSCPTHVTGKPLSHKEVNRSLKHHLVERASSLAALARAREPEARTTLREQLPALAGDVVAHETLWACTTCGACEAACPVLIDNIPRLVDLRRNQVLVEAAMPDEAARVFRNLETQGNPWGIGSNKRDEWCEGLGVPRAADGGDFEYLFFVGCAGAFDDRQKKVSRAIVEILRAAEVSFAILGQEETCTGDAARRLGNEYLFQTQASANVETFNRYGVKKVVVQCPHCLNAIRNEFPQFGGHYEVVHHTQLIAKLLAGGRLEVGAAAAFQGQAVTFHDPCYLARHNGETAAPRVALASAGVEVREMPRNGRTGFCCGAGGGRMWLEEKLGSRINQNRIDEAAETLSGGGGVVAVGCPFCLTMLKDGVAETGRDEALKVVDVAEIVAAGLVAPREAGAGAP